MAFTLDENPEVSETAPCVDEYCIAGFWVGVGVGAGKWSIQISFPAESVPIQTCARLKSGRQYQPPYCLAGVGCIFVDKG